MSTRTYTYDSDAIKRMLPHRWPMLMIDRAYDVVPGHSGKAIKNVTISEPYFAGHYPDHSIMPGVLQIEAMAQLVAIIYVSEMVEGEHAPETASDAVGYLGSISKVKFTKPVVPGDQLILEARMGPRLGGLRSVTVSASVDGVTVVSGSLAVTERSGGGTP